MIEVCTSRRPLTLEDCRAGIAGVSETRIEPADLIDLLLDQQQCLSAVEEFSRSRIRPSPPDQSRYYSKLLPASPPGPGQQYAFDVDLDRCSGCKACVVACHALNGLDDGETWRDVGLLVGGTESQPVMQHVTAACHHCLDPGCLNACPVNAYEKDPITGIVRHLDDQCFGCQYCTLACPYDVPKYHRGKGIVRKCDMCSNRLSQGEAPACVQSCPHEAIAIQVVNVADVIENSEADNFLPAAPEPYHTLPTTTYRTRRVYPRNMLPADYYSISPQHPHWPLILMLVLTQLSVGTFITSCWLERSLSSILGPLFRPFLATSALALGLLALGASTLHLGRPQYAFRGILGFRHSWLSREILAFGVFAGLAVPYAGLCWATAWPTIAQTSWAGQVVMLLPPAGVAVAATGMIGVFCSVMIYVFTKRELWSFERTLTRFSLTSAVLGIATTWLSLSTMGWCIDPATFRDIAESLTRPLAEALIGASSAKLILDLLLLRHLLNFRNTPLKRSARLVVRTLGRISLARVAFGLLGGIVIPFFVLRGFQQDTDHAGMMSFLPALSIWTGCLLGEVFERYLFFAVVSAPRMPGSVRP